MTKYCEWEKPDDRWRTGCGWRTPGISVLPSQYPTCLFCGKPVREKQQRNPLALPETKYEKGRKLTPHNEELGYGWKRFEAIIRCRTVLDKHRPDDYVPDWADNNQLKVTPFYNWYTQSFGFSDRTIHQCAELWCCLPGTALWIQALEEMGEDDLYLALYGEML